MEFYIMATRARENNNVGGHYQGQRPFRQPLRPPFRGGQQNRRGMGRSVRGWTPLDVQEGIAGVSTGMAFGGRQTTSL